MCCCESQPRDGLCVRKGTWIGCWCYSGLVTTTRAFLGWYSPGCGLLCVAEPDETAPAVAHPMPSTPAPPFQPYQPCSWAIDLRNC